MLAAMGAAVELASEAAAAWGVASAEAVLVVLGVALVMVAKHNHRPKCRLWSNLCCKDLRRGHWDNRHNHHPTRQSNIRIMRKHWWCILRSTPNAS